MYNICIMIINFSTYYIYNTYILCIIHRDTNTCALTGAHMHKPHDHRREELSRSHRIFLSLSTGKDQTPTSILSGGLSISTRICDLEARLPGANAGAA